MRELNRAAGVKKEGLDPMIPLVGCVGRSNTKGHCEIPAFWAEEIYLTSPLTESLKLHYGLFD